MLELIYQNNRGAKSAFFIIGLILVNICTYIFLRHRKGRQNSLGKYTLGIDVVSKFIEMEKEANDMYWSGSVLMCSSHIILDSKIIRMTHVLDEKHL